MKKTVSESAVAITSQDQKKFSALLTKYIGANQQLLVQKTEMGGTQAYVGSVTLEWFAGQVHFASFLPLLRNKYNPDTDNIEIDASSIDDIQQRPLDWSRQAPLVQYLAARKNHKFPPVLAVISQSWVDNSQASEWDSKGRATKSTTDFTALDEDGKFGLLDISEENVTIYALDGQHRLMAVQGLMEILKTGKLPRYKKDKAAANNFITVDDLTEKYSVAAEYLQQLPQEKIGIEFICAVAQGETREEARRRVRSIFVHVNLMAVPLSKGQLAQLNEDDGFSIVARKIAVSHPLLEQRQDRNPRINWNSATVAAKSTVLTTLQALKEMSERYLEHKYPHWKPLDKGLIPMRPEEEELEEATEDFQELFDNLANLPSYKLLEYEDTPMFRRFSFEKDGGEGNILFRPIGQMALAKALGILIFQKGFSSEAIFKKLKQFDNQGGFSGMEFPKSAWYGVLYDANRKRVLVAGKELATRLLVYILGGVEDKMERAELRKDLAKARTFEEQTVDFKGKFVEPKQVGLPEVL
ncbi:DGQHR domain-containing protein [Rivularia sp. UHCC 0363]|uniref:DGQHR domain-containing protein n=1 Tax=Rivularia sp. UHCC 0363 TaxID=3110244 RepID=UPI002B210F2A|nr:DGQHR domain-containing protein [Rivularia sp. UHCC 0363]MEA5596526.1 DGQHR domain-containing protein [Rivularia sp. UHCC 0363]